MRVLVLRPEPQAGRTAAALRALGHEAIVAPMLVIRPIAGAVDAVRAAAVRTNIVALTSPQALPALGVPAAALGLAGRRVFAIGAATAASARDAGFTEVIDAGGDVAALVRRLGGEPAGRMLYLSGRDRAGDLSAGGLPVETVEVYEAAPTDNLPADAADALRSERVDAVLVASARTAAAFVACLSHLGLAGRIATLRFVVIAEAAAAPLRAAGATRVEIAAAPDGSAMLRLVGSG